MGILTGLWWHGGGAQGGAERPGQGPCAEPSWVVVSVGMSCCARGTAGSPTRGAYKADEDPRAGDIG
jgi:hypothetical protein